MTKRLIYHAALFSLIAVFGWGVFLIFKYFFQVIATLSLAFSGTHHIKLWIAVPALLLTVTAACNYPVLYVAGIRLSYLHHKRRKHFKALASLLLPLISISVLMLIYLVVVFFQHQTIT